MKIVAGIGSIDDYETYVRAGADELFCGYVPLHYMQRFGRTKPINRREVSYYNVQIGSESELMILAEMVKKYKVPVSIALNALSFSDEQLVYITEIVRSCMRYGFKRFIIADLGLLNALSAIDGIEMTLSGEFGELNHYMFEKSLPVNRIIFPRQTEAGEMDALINYIRNADGQIQEFEAFALNEKCHFTGAYCNSLHCDELCHLCRVGYKLSFSPKVQAVACQDTVTGRNKLIQEESDIYIPGESGCNICNLWKLREVGVTHLKLVSRGAASDLTEKDIRCMKKALSILEESEDESAFKQKVFDLIFPNGCGHNCYL